MLPLLAFMIKFQIPIFDYHIHPIKLEPNEQRRDSNEQNIDGLLLISSSPQGEMTFGLDPVRNSGMLNRFAHYPYFMCICVHLKGDGVWIKYDIVYVRV